MKVIADISTLSDLFSEDHKCLVESHKVMPFKRNLFVHPKTKPPTVVWKVETFQIEGIHHFELFGFQF